MKVSFDIDPQEWEKITGLIIKLTVLFIVVYLTINGNIAEAVSLATKVK